MSKKIIGVIYEKDRNTGPDFPDEWGEQILFYMFAFVWLGVVENTIASGLLANFAIAIFFSWLAGKMYSGYSPFKDVVMSQLDITNEIKTRDYLRFWIWTIFCLMMIWGVLDNSDLSFNDYSTFVSPILIIIIWFLKKPGNTFVLTKSLPFFKRNN